MKKLLALLLTLTLTASIFAMLPTVSAEGEIRGNSIGNQANGSQVGFTDQYIFYQHNVDFYPYSTLHTRRARTYGGAVHFL